MLLRTKLTYTGLVLWLVTALGALAQAQQPSTQNPAAGPGRRARVEARGFRRGPGLGGGFGPRVLRELNLTDEQKNQVRTAIQQSFEGSKATRDELRQLAAKRRQGTLTSEDEARARTLHEQMRASMKDTQTKISGVLTAEQKARAAELSKEPRAKPERFGPRRGFPGKRGQDNPPPQNR